MVSVVSFATLFLIKMEASHHPHATHTVHNYSEPTVNLDQENMRGLAEAMAQIIQARSIQSNFQLVLITHDESFITMMKDELSTQTGFSMPEKYFQVFREEANDGKFYSKIQANSWDELL